MSSSSRIAVNVIGQTLVVFAGNVFTLVAGLPFQIYLARTLGANQLGLFGLTEAAVVTLSGFLSFGIAATAVRFIPEYLAKGEHEQIRRLVLLSTLALAVIGLALAGGIVLLSGPVTKWFGIDPMAEKLVQVMALTAPLTLLTFLYQQILRGFQEIIIMILSTSVAALLVKIILTFLLFYLGWGVQGYAWAGLGGGIASLALMVTGAIRLISRLDRRGTTAAAPLGLWARYASISYATGQASNVAASLDRFILGATVSSEAVGTLMVVRQLQQLPVVFHQMFIAVVAPMFAAVHGEGAGSRRLALYHLTTDWVMRLALPLVLFLAIFGGPLLALYGEQFRANGTLLLTLFLLGVSVIIVSGPTGSLMTMVGLEASHMRLSWLSSCITVALYGLLIPLVGLLGVGISAVASTLFINLTALRIMRKRLDFVWWSPRYVNSAVSGGIVLVVLLALRAGLGGSRDISAVWLVVGLVTAYCCFLFASLCMGASDDDRAVFDILMVRLGLVTSPSKNVSQS